VTPPRALPVPNFVEPLESRRLLSAGDLDPTFGAGGKVVSDPSGGEDTAAAVATTDDGSVLVGGTTWTGTQWTFEITRHTADGVLDPTFGTGGTVRTTEFRAVQQTGWAWASSLGLTPDGKIVAAGPTGFDFSPTSNFALARYDGAGRLDPSFAGDGTLEVFL